MHQKKLVWYPNMPAIQRLNNEAQSRDRAHDKLNFCRNWKSATSFSIALGTVDIDFHINENSRLVTLGK